MRSHISGCFCYVLLQCQETWLFKDIQQPRIISHPWNLSAAVRAAAPSPVFPARDQAKGTVPLRTLLTYRGRERAEPSLFGGGGGTTTSWLHFSGPKRSHGQACLPWGRNFNLPGTTTRVGLSQEAQWIFWHLAGIRCISRTTLSINGSLTYTIMLKLIVQ